MSRKETIIAAILLVVLGTSMHFVHHLPCFNILTGYLTYNAPEWIVFADLG